LAITVLTSGIISRRMFDVSYDGQSYHQEAILQLADNWNPIYQRISQSEASGLDKWVNHYPKASEIFESLIYKLTGNIEDTKLLQYLFILAAFSFSFSLLITFQQLRWWQSLAIALLLAANPVTIYQIFSLYVDGIFSSLLISLICVLIINLFSTRKYASFVLIMIIAITLNIKLTAVAYVGVLVVGFILIAFLREHLPIFLRVSKTALVGFFIGFFVIGINPYITNTLFKGNPLYPALGKGSIDYRPDNMPGNLIDNNSLTTLFYSAFSKSGLKSPQYSAELKLPFTYNKTELEPFSWNNTHVGGWGPLFSGALVLSSIIFLAALWYKNHYFSLKTMLLVVLILIVSAAINPVSSLARYTPQFYLVTICALFFAFTFKQLPMKILGYALVLTLAMNSYLIGHQYIIYNMAVSKDWNSKLESLHERSLTAPVNVNFGQFHSSGSNRFQRYAVTFQEVSAENCIHPQRIFSNSIIEECLGNK
jgi:hypothetical protein